MEALYWLVSRADRDHLLLATGSRPRGLALRHPLWSRFVAGGGPSVQAVDLRGLSAEHVGILLQQRSGAPVRASEARM